MMNFAELFPAYKERLLKYDGSYKKYFQRISSALESNDHTLLRATIFSDDPNDPPAYMQTMQWNDVMCNEPASNTTPCRLIDVKKKKSTVPVIPADNLITVDRQSGIVGNSSNPSNSYFFHLIDGVVISLCYGDPTNSPVILYSVGETEKKALVKPYPHVDLIDVLIDEQLYQILVEDVEAKKQRSEELILHRSVLSPIIRLSTTNRCGSGNLARDLPYTIYPNATYDEQTGCLLLVGRNRDGSCALYSLYLMNLISRLTNLELKKVDVVWDCLFTCPAKNQYIVLEQVSQRCVSFDVMEIAKDTLERRIVSNITGQLDCVYQMNQTLGYAVKQPQSSIPRPSSLTEKINNVGSTAS
jgi:hypothetical protein